MATGMINPIYDPREAKLKRQLAIAESLRAKGQTDDIGGGYQGGNVYIVGNPLSKIANAIGGEYLNYKGNEGMGQLGQEQQLARDKFLGAMPSSEEEVPVQMEAEGPPTADGQMPTMNSGQTQMLPKSSERYAKEMQAWGMTAPAGMENVQSHALTQALNMPEAMAKKEQDIIARRDAAKLAQEAALERARIAAEAVARDKEFKNSLLTQAATLQREKFDEKKAADAAKIQTAAAEAQAKGEAEAGAAQEIIQTIDSMIGNEELGIPQHPGLGNAVGARVPYWRDIPGTDSAGFMAKQNRVESSARVHGVQQMKGAGAVSNAEGEAAAKASQDMDTAQNEVEYIDAAKRYRASLQKGIDRIKRGVRVSPSGAEYAVGAAPGAAPAGAAPAPVALPPPLPTGMAVTRTGKMTGPDGSTVTVVKGTDGRTYVQR